MLSGRRVGRRRRQEGEEAGGRGGGPRGGRERLPPRTPPGRQVLPVSVGGTGEGVDVKGGFRRGVPSLVFVRSMLGSGVGLPRAIRNLLTFS